MTLVIGLERKNIDDTMMMALCHGSDSENLEKQAIGKLVKPSFVYYLDIRIIAAIHARYINVLGTM